MEIVSKTGKWNFSTVQDTFFRRFPKKIQIISEREICGKMLFYVSVPFFTSQITLKICDISHWKCFIYIVLFDCMNVSPKTINCIEALICKSIPFRSTLSKCTYCCRIISPSPSRYSFVWFRVTQHTNTIILYKKLRHVPRLLCVWSTSSEWKERVEGARRRKRRWNSKIPRHNIEANSSQHSYSKSIDMCVYRVCWNHTVESMVK